MEREMGKREAFLIQAKREGAHKIIPKGRTPDQWARMRNIVGAHALGATYEELGKQYGVSRQRIRQIDENSLRGMRENCSQETQNQFPLEKILVDNRRSIRIRERISKKHGGLSSEIAEHVRAGITDLDEISKRTGRSKAKLAYARKTLRGWDITLPTKIVSYKNLEERINKEEDDIKLQKILDGLSDISIIDFMLHHRFNEQTQKQPLFISLSRMLREEGYHFKPNIVSVFAEALKEQHIPIRKAKRSMRESKGEKRPLTYYILLNKSKLKTLEAINNTPSLAHFRKTQFN